MFIDSEDASCCARWNLCRFIVYTVLGFVRLIIRKAYIVDCGLIRAIGAAIGNAVDLILSEDMKFSV